MTKKNVTDIQTALAIKAKGGDEKALEELVRLNRGIMIRIIQKFAKYCADKSSDLWEDLLQEGAIGIIEAVQRFDANAGVKFLTYAHNYILKNISMAVYARGPGAIKRSYYDIVKMIKAEGDRRALALKVLSLDFVLNQEESKGTGMHSFVSDTMRGNPENVAENRILVENIKNAIQEIPDKRIQRVLVGYFGLNGSKCKIVAELADELEMSKSTIWNLIQKGLRTLEKSPDLWRPDFFVLSV